MSHREHDPDSPQLPDAAAYVLGALEDAELASFREHMEGCAPCRAEVANLQVVVDELPRATGGKVAKGELRARARAHG